MKQYLITRMQGGVFSFLLHGQKTVEIHCDPDATAGLLGNIYIGRIKNIAKNIGAVFIEIAPGQVCHLALKDMQSPIYTKKGASRLPQAGDELLVQVSREGIKTKYPSVSTNLTFHGKYVLLTTGNTAISVSAKLPGERREQLRNFVEYWENNKTVLHLQGAGYDDGSPYSELEHSGTSQHSELENSEHQRRPFGWLFRTNAGSASVREFVAELTALRERYETLLSQAKFRTCFSCLSSTPPSYLSRLADLYDSDAEQILTDNEKLYSEISEYLTHHQPGDLGRLVRSEDRMLPMQKLYSLEHRLEQALREKVWLDSGGYLVIQPTEALTVIDVNTGKFEGGKKTEDAFLKINLQAAIEIARQLRLRNISGIIIIDFINMKEETSKKTLLSLLENELRKDPIPTCLVDMTKLSLVEITRKKKEKSLAQCCRECAVPK